MSSTRVRLGALVTSVLTILGLVAGTAPAMAAPSGAAGTWLTHQVGSNGLVHNDQYGFDDYGLTIDTVFGILATKGVTTKVLRARGAIADHVNSYTTGVDWGSSDVYAGATAKAAVFAAVTGGRPRAFGGVNLIHRLAGLISSTSPTKGRLEDRTTSTDYANVIGQAYAAAALSRAGNTKAPSAIRYLMKQQCPAGWFRLEFSPKSGPQSCADATGSTRTPDTDATALALLQLSGLRHQTVAVRTAQTKALRWLTKHQRTGGGFGGGVSTSSPNANSTGLAAAALAVGGRCSAVHDAVRWLSHLQVTTASGSALAHELGAVAYDRAAFAAGRQSGIDTASRDQWRRATAQAALGLAAGRECA